MSIWTCASDFSLGFISTLPNGQTYNAELDQELDVSAFGGSNVSSGENLAWRDLRARNLRSAELANANLLFANLAGVDLSKADLNGANLLDNNTRNGNRNGNSNRFFNLKSYNSQ